jgi:hypothetical protein
VAPAISFHPRSKVSRLGEAILAEVIGGYWMGFTSHAERLASQV